MFGLDDNRSCHLGRRGSDLGRGFGCARHRGLGGRDRHEGGASLGRCATLAVLLHRGVVGGAVEADPVGPSSLADCGDPLVAGRIPLP